MSFAQLYDCTFCCYPEAHKVYGGIGTLLVINVSHFTMDSVHIVSVKLLPFLLSNSSSVFSNSLPLPHAKYSLQLSLQVSTESASQFGELVADPTSKEVLHYTEKPETFVCITIKLHMLDLEVD